MIGETARRCAEAKTIKYSHMGLPFGVIGHTADSGTKDLTKANRAALDSNESVAMFCSEFVAFCLNCATDDLKLPRVFPMAQDRITPEEVYVLLRESSDFRYIGELHKHRR